MKDLDACLPVEFRKILFRPLAPERLAAVGAYIRSLEPEPSPYRQANGELSEEARRGQRTFESKRAKCSTCHPAPLFTSKKMEGVGTRGAFDHAASFDVPSLVEVRRTAPYFHDGSVRTLRDVVTIANPNDTHGVTSHLTPEQIDELVAYLSSL